MIALAMEVEKLKKDLGVAKKRYNSNFEIEFDAYWVIIKSSWNNVKDILRWKWINLTF